MLDWLIVGGGPQGGLIARALGAAAPGAAVAVLDCRAPLDAWTRRARACGMQYLRSSAAHHLGARPGDLRRFAAAHGFDAAHWLGRYRRPSRALFEAHAAQALAGAERIRNRAMALEPTAGGWRVITASGAPQYARRVVLATGPGRPLRPAGGDCAEHVYDADFDARTTAPGARVVVIGGGTSGAQLALRLAAQETTVHWLTRARPRAADFDSDPGYAGRKRLVPFSRAPRPERRALLAAARRPGSLPPDVMAQITARLAAGEIIWHYSAHARLGDAGVCLDGGADLPADRVVLATGFEPRAGAYTLLGGVIQRLGLAVDADGHVDVDDQLQAAPGLHLAGRPASLALGPMAGNIRGAQLAAGRLAAVAVGAAGGARARHAISGGASLR